MLNFDSYDVLTFDCYGTLIDWETGIWDALRPILARYNVRLTMDDALALYGALEADAEQGAYREYTAVLRLVLEGFGTKFQFTLSEEDLRAFSQSVRNWPAFPDSSRALQALHSQYKLAIISNIDDALFAHSARRLQVDFDWVITAQQARSYKPSLTNFDFATRRIGLPKEKILHVAQSLFHDIVPAKAFGLSTVWVNRRRDKSGSGATPPAQATPDLEVPSLEALARAIGVM